MGLFRIMVSHTRTSYITYEITADGVAAAEAKAYDFTNGWALPGSELIGESDTEEEDFDLISIEELDR